MSAHTWHYELNGEQRGPVSGSEFETLVREGRIAADSLVWQEGMQDWQPAGEVELLRELLAAAPASSPTGGPGTGVPDDIQPAPVPVRAPSYRVFVLPGLALALLVGGFFAYWSGASSDRAHQGPALLPDTPQPGVTDQDRQAAELGYQNAKQEYFMRRDMGEDPLQAARRATSKFGPAYMARLAQEVPEVKDRLSAGNRGSAPPVIQPIPAVPPVSNAPQEQQPTAPPLSNESQERSDTSLKEEREYQAVRREYLKRKSVEGPVKAARNSVFGLEPSIFERLVEEDADLQAALAQAQQSPPGPPPEQTRPESAAPEVKTTSAPEQKVESEKSTVGLIEISFAAADDRKKFVFSGGNWRVQNGELLGTCEKALSWATLNQAFRSIRSVTIQARIVPPSTNELRFWIGPIHGTLNWSETDVNRFRNNGPKFTETRPHALKPGQVHEIVLSQDGSQITCTVDGAVQYKTTGRLEGMVSVQAAWGSTIAIRKLVIDADPDPTRRVTAETRDIPRK